MEPCIAALGRLTLTLSRRTAVLCGVMGSTGGPVTPSSAVPRAVSVLPKIASARYLQTSPQVNWSRRAPKGLKNMPAVALEDRERINLNSLRNVPGATKQKIRVGRGRSGRRGKTAGRGHKGTGQHGHLPFWFQGGQTPLWIQVPKRGKPDAKLRYKYVPLNIGAVVDAVRAGKLDAAYPINLHHMWKVGLVTGTFKSIARDRWGVKLLSKGSEKLDFPVTIEVQKASQSAIKAVEDAGGVIKCKYYNRLGLRALLLPEKFDVIPRLPMPPPKVRAWYEKPENRGVLATDLPPFANSE